MAANAGYGLAEEYWANRLQDWRLRIGVLECLVWGVYRNLHLLNLQIVSEGSQFITTVDLTLTGDFAEELNGVVDFLIGLKGNFPGYQSA